MQSIDLSGFQFTDGGSGNIFVFEEGSIIDPLGYFLVAGSTELFLYEFGANFDLTGSFNNGTGGFKLSNEGEHLILKNSKGEEEDYVLYDNQSPWPSVADGKGPSLQLIAPEMDNNHYSSWYASSGIPFSPGKPNGGNSINQQNTLPGNSILVYPNPMGKVLHIDHNEEAGAKLQVEAYTLSGTLINSALFWAGGGKESLSWQHGIASPGAYLVRIAVHYGDSYREESHLLLFSGSR
jgi:hypothetical protein